MKKSTPFGKANAMQVTITTVISIILGILVWFLFNEHLDWSKENDSTNLRNLVLSIVAAGGIPFVILANRIRSKDLLLKTESETLKILIEQIKSDSDLLRDVPLLKIPVIVSNRGKENIYNRLRVIGSITEDEFVKQEAFWDIRRDLSSWPNMERACQSIDSILKITNNFRNTDFVNLVQHKMVAELGEMKIMALFAVSVILQEYDGKENTLSEKIYELGNNDVISSATTESLGNIEKRLKSVIKSAVYEEKNVNRSIE